MKLGWKLFNQAHIVQHSLLLYPLVSMKLHFSPGEEVTHLHFPLTLAWATTIHQPPQIPHMPTSLCYTVVRKGIACSFFSIVVWGGSVFTLDGRVVDMKSVEKIRKNKWYSIMADECTDVANKEQFKLYIRSVDESLQVREKFIGPYEMAEINSEVSLPQSRICFLEWICQSLNAVANAMTGPLIWVAAELA